MPRLRKFFDELKERNVRKTLTIYMSSALTATGIVKLFTEAYRLPPVLFSVTVTLLTFGLASAFALAWFHGKKGARRFQPKEIALHGIFFAGALFVSFRLIGAPPPSHLSVDGEEVPSIAILYLKNLGPEEDEPYSYGITQDLIVDIAKAGLVRVAPKKDILFFQSGTVTIDSIALKLHVRYVLDASIRREGDILRLSGQIVEARTGRTLWADHMRTTMSEAASLQGQLARTIISVLNLNPSESVRKDITAARSTNPDVYEFYLRAKYLYDKRATKEDILTARGMYLKAIELDSTFVPARIGLGQTHESQGEYSQAEQIYRHALQTARKSEIRIEEAVALSRLGVVEWYREDFPKALEYYTQSLTISVEIGDREGEGRTLNNIGLVYHIQGDYTTALDYYTKSLTIGLALGDRWAEARTPNNIGNVYSNLGEYDKALDYYGRALRMRQELGDKPGECITLSNIGNVYDLKGEYGKALDHYSQTLRITQELGDRVGEGMILTAIGSIYHKQGKYAEAIDALRKAQSFMRLTERPATATALSWLAFAEMKVGDRKSAQAHADTVETLLKSAPRTEEFVEICWNLYNINSLIGNRQKMSEYLEQAYREVSSRADRIGDEGLRQSYLTNVPTVRAVVAAWNGKGQASR